MRHKGKGMGGEAGHADRRQPGRAVASLLAGALVWGVIWYPYRILRDLGVDGIVGTTSSYAVALLLALVFFRPARGAFTPRWNLFWLALAAGGCNLGYVLATLHGEVVRVLLLFYLAPLWTVLLARILLGERLDRFGLFVVALSLAGAATILWHPGAGLPLPRDKADWLGLGAGFSFALFNVLSRHARAAAVETKVLAVFAGVVIVGLALSLGGFGAAAMPAATGAWLLIGLLGAVLIVINIVVQYGLAHVPANRAIVIMLTEVGFAAFFSWLLAGESFGLREALGGALVVAASLFSARMQEAGSGK